MNYSMNMVLILSNPSKNLLKSSKRKTKMGKKQQKEKIINYDEAFSKLPQHVQSYVKEKEKQIDQWVEETGNSKTIEEFLENAKLRDKTQKGLREYLKRYGFHLWERPFENSEVVLPKLAKKKCIVCKEEFQPKREDHEICSLKCFFKNENGDQPINITLDSFANKNKKKEKEK